ncbi:MAG: winged helix-turn-helix transcriptional regulator [Bacteroidales bacterium]|nr:winged helix-turn-helix transcriptional regulator [Bacteroidales bacterium]
MNKGVAFEADILQIAAFAKAMSHPVRVYILKKLSQIDGCCYSGNLVEELPVGRSALSRHLKELKFAGLIQGQTEPPFIKYCINRENWEKAGAMCGFLFNK